MSKKRKQYVEIGKWVEGKFVPLEEQPEVTTQREAVLWLRDKFGDVPGEYSFIKLLPGRVDIVEQLKFSFTGE